MTLTAELRSELQLLLAAARAQLEFERSCGSPGVWRVPPPRFEAGGLHEAEAFAPPVAPPTGVEPVRAEPRQSVAPAAQPSMRFESAVAAVAPELERSGQPPRAALGLEARVQHLEVLAQQAAACTACVLHEKRQQAVFARGSALAELAFVGEGPGRDEDQQGQPFVGAAGKLLDRMITAMGYGRDEVYVCNVVKCRPPENRTPRPEEALACARFLVPQLETVAPKLIVALGRCAAQALGVAEVSGPWRGRFGAWRGITVMPTYHPAFLLRSPEFKRTVWEDLQQVMARLGRSPKA